MEEINPFTNAIRFSRIVQNSTALNILLRIAENKTRTYDELEQDMSLTLATIAPIVDDLEKGGFIEKNPNPLSRKFKLAFNGQLFLEQLKSEYSELRELLGEKSLIQPIKIKKQVCV